MITLIFTLERPAIALRGPCDACGGAACPDTSGRLLAYSAECEVLPHLGIVEVVLCPKCRERLGVDCP